MPIPNVSTLYQRISQGAEGGHEFARFIKLLLGTDYSSQKVHFISESDASGDYKKVDAYISGDKDFPPLITGFQFKFYPFKLSAKQKANIVESIEGAIKENEFIQEFILITPEDFYKEQQEWFDDLRKKYEKSYWASSNGITRLSKFKLIHWGHTKIIELALKHDHIGNRYFPELFPLGVGKFKLSKVAIDSELCSWHTSSHHFNSYYQSSVDEDDVVRTSDPIFDFQFKNSSNEIHLLNRIEIHIEEIGSTMNGLPSGETLRSIGTLEVDIDFTEPINTIPLADPLIFQSNSPKRFNIKLNSFSKKCPGNWVRIKFWFFFDDITIPTDSFMLGM